MGLGLGASVLRLLTSLLLGDVRLAGEETLRRGAAQAVPPNCPEAP